MLVDTHCHLNFKDFDKDRNGIINRCLSNDIYVINVGVNYRSSKAVVELAQRYDKGIYAAIAVHPHDVNGKEFNKDKFLELGKKPKVVAIGETGLDYASCEDDEKMQKLQQRVFVNHLELAKELNKPVIIHSRRLFPEILEIIKKYPEIKGVLHCYMGRWSYAQEYLKLGFYLSFTGLITYARDYDKVIKNTLLERIMIETDSPYLVPDPVREEKNKPRNTPLNVKYVAQKIAEIKEIPFKKIADQTSKNAKKLFNLL